MQITLSRLSFKDLVEQSVSLQIQSFVLETVLPMCLCIYLNIAMIVSYRL